MSELDNLPPGARAAVEDLLTTRAIRIAQFGRLDFPAVGWAANLASLAGQVCNDALLSLAMTEDLHRYRARLVELGATVLLALESFDQGDFEGAPARRPVPRAETLVNEDGVLLVDIYAPLGVNAIRPRLICAREDKP